MKVDLDDVADKVRKVLSEFICGFGEVYCDHKTCDAVKDARKAVFTLFENMKKCPTCNGTGKRHG